MNLFLKAIVAIFLVVVAGTALASVVPISVNKSNQAEVSGYRLEINGERAQDDNMIHLTIRISPKEHESVVRCSLEGREDKRLLFAVSPEIERTEHGLFVRAVLRNTLVPYCTLFLTIDHAKPDAPVVGREYQIHLRSYFDEAPNKMPGHGR